MLTVLEKHSLNSWKLWDDVSPLDINLINLVASVYLFGNDIYFSRTFITLIYFTFISLSKLFTIHYLTVNIQECMCFFFVCSHIITKHGYCRCVCVCISGWGSGGVYIDVSE